jgi:hypothetical protein
VRVDAVGAFIMPAVTVKLADIVPAGIITLEGTVAAAVFELESDTIAPPAPAAAVRLSVPVEVCPLTIVLGLTATLLKAAGGGLMVTPKVTFTPEYEAVSVAAVEALTVPAVTVNVAVVAPAATFTLEGTLAAVALELESETVAPLVPDGAVRVTVPVPVWPLTIALGLTEILPSADDSGLMVTLNVLLTPE